MHRRHTGLYLQHLAVCLFVVLTATSPGAADIYEWEYIDPLQPELGKQESTILTPEGGGVELGPYANLFNLNLRKAFLIGAELPNMNGYASDFTQADFRSANLTDAGFGRGTDFTDADFSGADLTNADISATYLNTNFSLAIINGATISGDFSFSQLASTASYQNYDLSRVRLWVDDVSGWDLSNQDLTYADLSGRPVLDVNFSGTTILGANLRFSEITQAQLTSTASYKTGDLRWVMLGSTDLTGWDLSSKNFEGANFTGIYSYPGAILNQANLSGSNLRQARFAGTTLIGADLSNTNLTSAYFGQPSAYQPPAVMIGSILNGADTRGSHNFNRESVGDISNLILPNGTIEGLTLEPTEQMRFWDYDEEISIPVLVEQAWEVNHGALVSFLFEDPSWGSTISFDTSVGTAYLGGTLELSMKLDDGLFPGDLLGATFDLFDWDGVTIDGAFDAIVLDPSWYTAGLSFDLSQLMTTGDVRIVPLIGDLDGDGFVGITDLNLVLLNWNQEVAPGNLLAGDMNGDGFVGIEDLNGVLGTWNTAVPPPASGAGTAIPEPGGAVLLGTVGMALIARRNRYSAG